LEGEQAVAAGGVRRCMGTYGLAEEMDLRDAEGLFHVGLSVRGTDRLLRVLQFWMVQFTREQQTLAVYFRAVAIMLQLPGGARYEYAKALDALDDLRGFDRGTVLDLLAAALERLRAGELIEQVPSGRDHKCRALSDELAGMLAGRDHNGLLNVVAECLDYLIVRAGMAEIDAQLGVLEAAPAPTTVRALEQKEPRS